VILFLHERLLPEESSRNQPTSIGEEYEKNAGGFGVVQSELFVRTIRDVCGMCLQNNADVPG
jgi:hypothetical protein